MFRKLRENRAELKAKATLKVMAEGSWNCSKCDKEHTGLFDLAFFKPDAWEGPEEYASNSDLSLDGNFLSEDFCIINGENFLIRCVLMIPIYGLDESILFL